jgi:hypothetical protein
MQPTQTFNEAPLSDEIQKLEGADYLAVVVEWTDVADDDTTTPYGRPLRSELLHGRTLATVLGALGAIALTTWGLHRLKTA